MSKIFEKVVSDQLCSIFYIKNISMKNFSQALGPRHSTETALVKIMTCVRPWLHLIAIVLLDLSAAFDTIVHDILIDRLQNYTGIQGPALKWFRSCLRLLPLCLFKRGGISIITSKVWSTKRICPRSSVIFIIHVATWYIIRKYGIHFHCYADDTQLYISTRPEETSKLSKLTECVKNVKDWMTNNFLLLDSDKTEILLIWPKKT